MKRVTSALTLLSALACYVRPVSAGPPPATRQSAPDPTVQVYHLIGQLDDNDVRARDAASAALVHLGEAVRPDMVAVVDHGDSGEARARAAAVLVRLDRIAADLLTRITLRMTEASPRAVFLAVAKQAGVPIEFQPPDLWAEGKRRDGPPITVDFRNRPYWSALDDVCQLTGSEPQRMGTRRTLTIQKSRRPASLFVGAAVTSGRVTFAAGRQYAPAALGMDRVDSIDAFVDPQVDVRGDFAEFRFTQAVDASGRSLLSARDRAWDRAYGWNLLRGFMPAGLPAGPVRIANLRGELRLIVADGTAEVVVSVDRRADHVVTTVGPYTLTLSNAAVTQGSIDYVAEARMDERTPLAPLANLVQLRLEDGGGRRLFARPADRRGDAHQWVERSSMEAIGGIHGPVRFVWTVATNVRQATVPFALRNLVLPRR